MDQNMNQNRITPKFLGPIQGNDQDIIDLTCSDDENEERSEIIQDVNGINEEETIDISDDDIEEEEEEEEEEDDDSDDDIISLDDEEDEQQNTLCNIDNEIGDQNNELTQVANGITKSDGSDVKVNGNEANGIEMTKVSSDVNGTAVDRNGIVNEQNIESGPSRPFNSQSPTVDLTFDSTQASCSAFDDYEEGPSKKKLKTFDYKETDKLVDKYFELFNQKCPLNQDKRSQAIDKVKELVTKLKDKRPRYVASKEFSSLINSYIDDISMETELKKVYSYNKDLIIELNRLTIETQNQVANQKIDKATREKQINKLTKMLKKLQNEIVKAESAELSYEDMINDTTGFVSIPKLMKKAYQVWEKREKLLNRGTSNGRYFTKKFTFNGTKYPEINKEIEKFMNKYIKSISTITTDKTYKDETLTIIEVRNIISKVVNQHQLLDVTVDFIAENVFKHLRMELKNRRELEYNELFEDLENLDDLYPETMPVLNNPSLEKQLTTNSCTFNKKLDELVEKYKNEDIKQHGDIPSPADPEWNKDLSENDGYELLDNKDDLKEEEEEEEESASDNDDDDISMLPICDDLNQTNATENQSEQQQQNGMQQENAQENNQNDGDKK